MDTLHDRLPKLADDTRLRSTTPRTVLAVTKRLLLTVASGMFLLAGAPLGVTLAATPASAKPADPGTFHEVFSEVFEDFCDVPGLTVNVDGVVDGRFLDNTHSQEQLPFHAEHVEFTVVYTNPATGLSVRLVENSLFKDLSVDRDGDILTIVLLGTGNATVYGADGKAIARNPGQSRFRIVVDTNGTLFDPEDDEELSFEQIKGSTGRSDDFCEAVVPALQ